MSKQYRLMIYFAVATFLFYSKNIVSHSRMTVGEFREKNPDVVTRVFEEGKSFGYELSWEQMSRAIAAFIIGKYDPKSVADTEVYVFNEA
jgi:hypothetical protein